jgi:hypothetical protein
MQTPGGPVTPDSPQLRRGFPSVRLRDTLIPPTDVCNPPEPLPFAASLFDSVVSALRVYGMEIARLLACKFVLRT